LKREVGKKREDTVVVELEREEGRGIFVFSQWSDKKRDILVHSHEISQSELPHPLISDVAVINWIEGPIFK
jgi:hypothetical protein